MFCLSGGSEGTSFVLSFPPAASPNTNNISLSICTRSYDNVIVDVTQGEDNNPFTIIVSSTSCSTVQVSSSLRMTSGDSSTVRRNFGEIISNLTSIYISSTAFDYRLNFMKTEFNCLLYCVDMSMSLSYTQVIGLYLCLVSFLF